MAVKGMAVAALVATTGTAAVELPKVVHHDEPGRSAIGTAASASSSSAAISPLHDQVREQALAQAAAASRARRARAAREAAAARVRTSEPSEAARLNADRAAAQARALTPVPAANRTTAARRHDARRRRPRRRARRTPPPTSCSASATRSSPPSRTRRRWRGPGTQGALAAANALIQTTLGSLGPLVNEVLATLGLKLPSGTTTTPPPSSVPSNTTVTNVLAPVQSLLHGVDGLLKGLFGTG